MKDTKIFLILCGILGLSFLGNIKSLMQIKQLKDSNFRLSENYMNANAKIDSVVGKNNELHYALNGVVLEKQEFEDAHNELNQELKDMRIKTKHLESALKTNFKYVYKTDSIFIQKDSTKLDSVNLYFKSNLENEYIKTNWNSIVNVQQKSLNISDFNLVLNDSLTIATETIYKGWWIFKKVRGVKLHIKSENPYFKINELKYIKIKK